MQRSGISLAYIIILLFLDFTIKAQLLAFPEAQGFGKSAIGGRGGDVLFVTNLNDSGPGSLREACAASGPRTIIFTLGGTITLDSTIQIMNAHITIAGQTAPGGGICIRMNPESTSGILQATIAILADHVIIRGIRFRAGPNTAVANIQIHDCLDIWDGEHIILDHCSFTWGEDENIAIWSDSPNERPRKITIQNSIIGQGLQKLDNGNITRGFGMLVGGSTGADEVSIINNLFIHNAQRNPLLKSEQSSVFELQNNVIYNYGFLGTDLSDDVKVNLLSNYYAPGNNTLRSRYEVLIQGDASLYADGNVGPHRPSESFPEWDIVGFNGTIPPAAYSESPAPLNFQSNNPFTPIDNDISSAEEALNNIIVDMDVGANYRLDESGGLLNNLDDVDEQLIRDIINNTGTTIFDTDIGSSVEYPNLEKGVASIDLDQDGMPDIWEEKCGLDPSNPADRNQIAINGYTHLENYLNGVNLLTTSVDDVSIENIKAYPNPSDGILHIVNNNSEKETIIFYDNMGRKVYEAEINEELTELNISMLRSGIYLMRNTSSNWFKKVVLR